ncbi:MAG: hypothetical protein BWK72_18025 [Rhodoferax ferrireducens]|uniref:Conjugal transfer protein TraK n=1 Tax=Rhodoferax ferrireducens TaxID=192843 RepID=A0A1W9KQ50_9BURK|nr:MAG: hypothetical protein BWK72_18025 [Rhodoferax ferrireducens]
MAKSLSERIAARTVKKKPSRSAQNRAAFLALRVDIKQALDDGWPVKSIWETLHEEGKVDFSYQAFRGYANRLILSPPATEPPAPIPAAVIPEPGPSNPTKPASSKTAVKKPEPPAGFTFNSKPNKEDLL